VTQPKSVLCHFHLVLALCSSILFSAFLSSSAAYAMPMQANSLHTTGQHSQRAYHCRAYHEVHAGQNLYRISIHYNVNTHILAQVNGIHDINHVPAGQILCIPDLDLARQQIAAIHIVRLHLPQHLFRLHLHPRLHSRLHLCLRLPQP